MATTRGPIPKRSTERRRRNKPEAEITHAESKHEPTWPEPDPTWHPIARDMYLATQVSGQSQFFEQSDVQYCFWAAEMTHRALNARLNGLVLGTVLDMWGNLLATEGDRRRLRVELERQKPEAPPSVLLLSKYREAAGE